MEKQALLSEKHEIELVKGEHFEQNNDNWDADEDELGRQAEVGLQQHEGEECHALDGEEEQVGLHPSLHALAVEEHAARQPVECGLQQGAGPDGAGVERDDPVVVGAEGVGDEALGVEEVGQCQEQAGLHGEEELEAQLLGGLGDGGGVLALHAEEGLGLAQDEVARVGERHGHQYEAGQQERRDEVVAREVVGHGVARHARPPSEQLGVEAGLAVEVGLAVVDGQLHVAQAATLVVAGQVERVGLLAPVDGLGLEVGLYGRVLLRGRGILGQPTQHLCRRERGGRCGMGLRGLPRGFGLRGGGMGCKAVGGLAVHQIPKSSRILSTQSSFSQVKSSTCMVFVSW